MSIFGKSGGAKVSLVPRVKHNGVIKIPVSGWTKQNGVLKKIWAREIKVTGISLVITCEESQVTDGGWISTYNPNECPIYITATVTPANATNKQIGIHMETDFHQQDVRDFTINSGETIEAMVEGVSNSGGTFVSVRAYAAGSAGTIDTTVTFTVNFLE